MVGVIELVLVTYHHHDDNFLGLSLLILRPGDLIHPSTVSGRDINTQKSALQSLDGSGFRDHLQVKLKARDSSDPPSSLLCAFAGESVDLVWFYSGEGTLHFAQF